MKFILLFRSNINAYVIHAQVAIIIMYLIGVPRYEGDSKVHKYTIS